MSKILIVEDEESIAELEKDYLELSGFEVEIENNGTDLNGDLNLIGKEGEKFVVYGIPWCGTSKIFTTEKKELGGIVLLEKAPSEELVSLTEEQKTLRVMQRMISPPWTAELMVKNLKFAEAVAKEKPVYFLRCTKNDTAAETIRRQIEEDEKRQKAGSDDCMKNMKKRIPKEQAQEDES